MTAQIHTAYPCLSHKNHNQSPTPKVDINLIGPTLKEKRRTAGLTGDKAAELLFMSIRSVRYHEERGVRDILLLDRICRCYGIQLTDLIREIQS